MALTNTYVDPSIAADSGTGTVGDPYGDIQYALNTMTRDGTNGDRINIKAGTDEILAAALTLSTYGTPSFASPIMFRGYTAAAEDGGIGGIDGNATYTMIVNSTFDYIHFQDMHLHNTGAVYILSMDNNLTVVDCELDNTTAGGINADNTLWVSGCYFHNMSAFGVTFLDGNVRDNYFANGIKTFIAAIELQTTSTAFLSGNIISIGGSSNGIRYGRSTTVVGNTIYSPSGTGKGIVERSPTNAWVPAITNNLIEGFDGIGGVGIEVLSDIQLYLYGGNAVYNSTTEYSIAGLIISDVGDNESLSVSPFEKSGSDTFANRFTYFEPVDTGNVHGGAYPFGSRRDKGAVQHADAGGGGGGISHLVSVGGGLIG